MKCKKWNREKAATGAGCGKHRLKEERGNTGQLSLLRAGKMQEEACARLVGDGAGEIIAME